MSHKIYKLSPELDQHIDTNGALSPLIQNWFGKNYKVENESKFMQILENEDHFSQNSDEFLFALLRLSKQNHSIIPFISKIFSNPKLSRWLSSHFFYDSTPRFIAQLPPQVTSLGFIDPKYIKIVLHYFPRSISRIDAALFLFKDSLPSTARTRSGLIRHLCDIYIEASDAWNKIPMLNSNFLQTSTADTLPSVLLQSPDEMLLKQLPTLLQHYETYAKDFYSFQEKSTTYQQVLDTWSTSTSSWPDINHNGQASCFCCNLNYTNVQSEFSSAITTEKRERESISATYQTRFEHASVIARSYCHIPPNEIKTEQQQADEKAIEAIINQHSIQMKSNTDEFNTKQSLLLEQIQELTKQLDQNYQNYVDNTKEVFATIKTQVEAIGSSNTHPVFIPPTRPTIPTIIPLYQGDKIEAPTKDPFGIGDFNAAGDIFGPTFDLASSGKHYDNFWPFDWGHDPMNVLKIYRNISTGLCELSSQFESKMVRLDEEEKVNIAKRIKDAAAAQRKINLQQKKNTAINKSHFGKKGKKQVNASQSDDDDDYNDDSNDDWSASDYDEGDEDENQDNDDDVNLLRISDCELIHPQHYIEWFDRLAMQFIVSILIHQQKTAAKKNTESNTQRIHSDNEHFRSEYSHCVDTESIGTIISLIGNHNSDHQQTFVPRLLMLLRSHCLFPLLFRYLSSSADHQFSTFFDAIQEISPELSQQVSYQCHPFTLRFDEFTPELYSMLYDSYSGPLVSALQSSSDPTPVIQTTIRQLWDNNNNNQQLINPQQEERPYTNLPFTNLQTNPQFTTPLDSIFLNSLSSSNGTQFQMLFPGTLYIYGTSNSLQSFHNPLTTNNSPTSRAVTLHLLIETLSHHNFFNLFNLTWLADQYEEFNGMSSFFWLTNFCSLFNFLYSYSGLSKNDGIDTLLSDSKLLMFHQCEMYDNFIAFDAHDDAAANHTKLSSKTIFRPDRSRKLYGNENHKPSRSKKTTIPPINFFGDDEDYDNEHDELFQAMYGEGEIWDDDWEGEGVMWGDDWQSEGDFWYNDEDHEHVDVQEINPEEENAGVINNNDLSDEDAEEDEEDYYAVYHVNAFKLPQDRPDLPYIHHLAANIVWLIENHRLDQESALDSKVFTSEQIERAAQLTTLLFFPSQIQIDQYFQDVLTFFQSQTNPQLQHKYKNVQDIKDFYRKLLLNSLPPTSSPPTQIPTTNTIETTPTTTNDDETVTTTTTTTPTTSTRTPDSEQNQDEKPFCFTMGECHCLSCVKSNIGLPLPAKYLLHAFTDASVNSLPDKSDYYSTRYVSEVIGNSTDIISELICAIRMLQILYPDESPF